MECIQWPLGHKNFIIKNRMTPHNSHESKRKFRPPFRYKKSEMASYLHAAAGLLTKSTFIQAINNSNVITCTGITTNLISKHLPHYLPTLKVHLNQEQKNLRSTKPISEIVKLESEYPPNQESKMQDSFLH